MHGHYLPRSWEELPDGLLSRILLSQSASSQQRHGKPSSARLVCSSWRRVVDNSLTHLAPRRWPTAQLSAASTRQLLDTPQVDLSRLPLGGDCMATCHDPSCCKVSGNACSTGVGGCTAASCCCSPNYHSTSHSMDSSSRSSSQLDLLGAAVLQPRTYSAAAAATGDAASAADSECVVSVPGPLSSPAGTLTCFVASAWPEAVPHITPAACLRLWRLLPACHNVRHLHLPASMLPIQSVSTVVAGCADAAAGLSMLQQLQDQDDGSVSAASWARQPTIVHTYSLQVPDALCAMVGLQSFSIDWGVPPAPGSAEQHPKGSGSGGALVARRRSYEGGGSGSLTPVVQHATDRTVVLPRQLGSRLADLQRLELVGSITEPGSLQPLVGLRRLQGIVLGPGRLNMQAVAAVAAAGVLRPVTLLALKQEAAWDLPAVVAVLAALPCLEALEVQELDMSSAELASSGSQVQQALTAADAAPLAASLTSLTWAASSQRLLSGASLLCCGGAGAAAAVLPADTADLPAAAGAWFGGLASLQQLRLCGILQQGSVLGAPALDALSAALGACSSLQELSVQGLGLPMLPEGLARLQQLQRVSIVAAAVTRHSPASAEAALAVLGACRGLRSLTLSGCELRRLPLWLSRLAHVTQLQLDGNYLQELPGERPSLGLPPALRVLSLRDNRLRQLPGGIMQLSRLQQLHLDTNYLTSLPGSIWHLPVLQQLSMRENMLPELPECVGGSAAANNHLTRGARCAGSSSSSSSGLGALQHAGSRPAAAAEGIYEDDEDALLQALGVLQRPQGNLGVGVAAAAALAAPRGSWQQLQAGAVACPCSSSLTSLVVADNQLTQLPASISALSALQHLSLSRNQVRSLPDKAPVWELTRLTSLHLAGNHLAKLPAGLAKLHRLVELDVSGNHMAALADAAATAAAVAAGTADTRGACGASMSNASTTPVPAPAAPAPGVDEVALEAARPDNRAACSASSSDAASSLCNGAAGATGGKAASSSAAASCMQQLPASGPSPGQLQAAGVMTQATPVAAALQPCKAAATRRKGRTAAGSNGAKSGPAALPSPLALLPCLQTVVLGPQQAEAERHLCPLQLLLAGLSELAERIMCLAPPSHQCPVKRAAAAAVAHITGAVSSSKRAQADRQRQQLEQDMLNKSLGAPGLAAAKQQLQAQQ